MTPSEALQLHRDRVREILSQSGVRHPRIFGSVSRGEDTETSDLDIVIDAPSGTSLFDLARIEFELEATLGCRVEVLTEGFLAPDVRRRAKADLIDLP